jgi:tetratricopeptide (TPR) repeat protein
MTALHLLAIILATSPTGASYSAAPQEKSWVDSSVVPTKQAKDIKFWDRVDDKQIDFAFSGKFPLTVSADRDGLLRLSDGRREGWVKKVDFVLFSDSQAYFDRRVLANPRDAFALFMRGACWLEKGESDKAIEAYNDWIRLDPTDPFAFFNRGNAWRAKKKYDLAIKDYDRVIRFDPKNALAYFARGDCWSIKLDYDKAIKDYDKTISLDPNYPRAFSNRANIWSAKKEYDKAIKDYDEAIRLDSKDVRAIIARGYAWSAKKEYDKAIKDFDEALRLDPQQTLPVLARANLWRMKKDYDKAIKDYDLAIQFASKDALLYYTRGILHRTTKDYDKAIKDFDQAVRLDPKDSWALFDRSVVQMLLRRPEAVAGFQAVLDLQGLRGRAPYAVILGHLAARQKGDAAAAKRFLPDVTENLNPAWPNPVVRFLRGDIDEPALLNLATDDDKRLQAHFCLGLDQALRGKKTEALAHFRWVKDHGNVERFEYLIAVAELERLEKKA